MGDSWLKQLMESGRDAHWEEEQNKLSWLSRWWHRNDPKPSSGWTQGREDALKLGVGAIAGYVGGDIGCKLARKLCKGSDSRKCRALRWTCGKVYGGNKIEVSRDNLTGKEISSIINHRPDDIPGSGVLSVSDHEFHVPNKSVMEKKLEMEMAEKRADREQIMSNVLLSRKGVNRGSIYVNGYGGSVGKYNTRKYRRFN